MVFLDIINGKYCNYFPSMWVKRIEGGEKLGHSRSSQIYPHYFAKGLIMKDLSNAISWMTSNRHVEIEILF